MKKTVVTALLTLILFPILPLPTEAAEINLNHLISDSELTDYTSMRQIDIKNFLIKNDSVLKNMFFDVGEEKQVSATELIYRTAVANKINPKFILVLIEKEQSLVTGDNPSQRALDFATGYGCFTGQSCLDRWKGFPKQINSAAAQFRYYIENIDEYNFQPGKTVEVCNDSDNRCEYVTPVNVSTAALYVYTPHVHGNELFKRLWDKFFASEAIYPDGTLLKVVGEPGIWVIQNGTKRAFLSKSALVSRYNENAVIEVDKSDVDAFPDGQPIEFAAFTLVKDPQANYYLLTAAAKRKIASPEVFRTLGFNPEEAEDVTIEQIDDIPDANDITLDDAYPTGALIQNKVTGGVYYVEGSVKQPLWSREVMLTNFPKLKIFAASPAELDSYANGDPVKFKDGTLIKSNDQPDVFVISNGQRIKIGNEQTFNTLGYKWANIITTNQKVVDLHPLASELKI